MKIIVNESQFKETLLPFLESEEEKKEKYVADIEGNKEKIISLLRSTNRKGIENVINYLINSRFFTDWGSQRHHTYRGGLAEHSLGVCNGALIGATPEERNSIILCSLLHDIGKIRKESGISHSFRSLKTLEELGLELSPAEKNAIRFHTASMRAISKYDKDEYEAAREDKLLKRIRKNDFSDANAHGI